MYLLTSCINSTAALITPMIDAARDITYTTARRLIGGREMDEFAAAMSYDTYNERGGLRLRNDYHVSYGKSVYGGRPCVFIRHSAIEYVFVNE